ncbi:hypothetical protein F4777DRAFT_573007 [Nemania sp. FL0916]|nr:hypothetical protein F4777DRAFT_573007 [Nemania sp. FL0916]
MTPHPSTMESAPLYFTKPLSLQRFDIFQQFPYDVRHLVWEEAIFTPGIHFLKFVEAVNAPAVHAHNSTGHNSGGSSLTLPERRVGGGSDAQNPVYSATLKPIFPLACADNSHHIAVKRTLAQLRGACQEAKFMVDRVLAQPGNLTLNSGQLISLQRSSDVVCIDYPNITHHRSIGKWADRLNLDQLAKVRRLAVRYHHEWENDLVCGYCGRVHSYHGTHPYPRHVYEFASLFKNLETFYFIDYLTVRKPSRPTHCHRQGQNSGPPREKFLSGEGGRTYFEIDPESCTTHTHVYETLSWLRGNYVAYCTRRSRGPSRPESVNFKILACEWNSDQQLAPTKRPGTQATLTRKKRSKSRTRSSTTSLQNTLPNGNVSSQPITESLLPVAFGDGGKSKFEFSFEVPY